MLVTGSDLATPEITATGHLTHNKPSHFTNTGDSDASHDSMPSQYLLVRGLEPTVTEELLAKGIAKLYKPSERASPSANDSTKKPGPKVISTTSSANLGAQEGSIRRVFVVKDRRTNESWRYGFAEFHTVEVSLEGGMTGYDLTVNRMLKPRS